MAQSQLIKIRQFEFGPELENAEMVGENPLCLVLQVQKLLVEEDGQINFKIQNFPYHPNTQIKMTVNGEYFYDGESFDTDAQGRILWVDDYQLRTTDTVFVEYLVNVSEVRTEVDVDSEDYLYLVVDGEAVTVEVDGEQVPVFIERKTNEADKYYIRVAGEKVYLKFTSDNRYIFVNGSGGE
jgi:hypothetical protein